MFDAAAQWATLEANGQVVDDQLDRWTPNSTIFSCAIRGLSRGERAYASGRYGGVYLPCATRKNVTGDGGEHPRLSGVSMPPINGVSDRGGSVDNESIGFRCYGIHTTPLEWNG